MKYVSSKLYTTMVSNFSWLKPGDFSMAPGRVRFGKDRVLGRVS